MGLPDSTLDEVAAILSRLQPKDAVHLAMTMLVTSAKRMGVTAELLKSSTAVAIDTAVTKGLLDRG